MRPGRVARIARWEVTKGAGAVDRQTVVVVAVGLLLAGALAPAVASSGALDRGIYRVGVAPDSPYYGPADADPTFAVREPDREALEAGRLELVVRGDAIVVRDSPKGRAALAAFRDAVERYNDRRMAAEANATAAFPVTVTLTYVQREGATEVVVTNPVPGTDGTAGGGGEAGDGGAGGEAGAAGGGDDGGGGGDRRGVGRLPGGFGSLLGDDAGGTPSDIAPPFPFQSLVLAFAFVVPLNFVIQAYGSTILDERIDRRGELLLVAPVSRAEIIAGKTLPYFAAALGAAAAIAFAIGGTWLSVLGVAPLAFLFLAATFVGGMFARSYKELTFVTTAISVLLTAFAFVPAIFTGVGPVALISPLSLVVRDLQGAGVDPAGLAFATLPATLTAGVLFLLGAGVYREEDMFTQRPVRLKALDALAGRLHGWRSVPVLAALLLPFVFVAELLAVALLFALPIAVSLPVLLVAVAAIEEVVKSLPAVAGFAHARFDRTTRSALAVGALSGLGFFVGEKLTLTVQLVGLPRLRLGRAAFAVDAGAGAGTDGVVLLALVLAPLALHAATAAISAVGASRGRGDYLLGLGAAVAVHAAYNLAVVMALA